jgi:hypothetical protein
MRLPLAVLATISLGVMLAVPAPDQTEVQGVWRVTAIQDPRPNGRGTTTPEPGLFIFTAKYYSMVAAISEKERSEPKDPANATVAELKATYDPFIGNSGTYDISGNMITLHPVVAKLPSAAKPGNAITTSLTVDGNSMRMVYRQVEFKLTRVE